MNSLYRRLALDGIKRHKRLYVPFVGTTVFFIVLINICLSISADPVLKNFFGATTIGTLMDLGAIILLIFAFLTLLTNYNFIQKNKAEESALYLTLGMEKRHLIKIYVHELINLYLKSIILGTVISAVIYKLVLAVFIKMTNENINVLETAILPIIQPLILTGLIFLGIFIFLLANQIFKSRNFTPMSFREESKASQKAPKHPVLLGVFGIICIGIGYYISLTTQNPMQALQTFFLAVMFVIVGTYAAFAVIVSGILKLLQKNKNFYYKKSNFTAVSGLIYRVRNSANTLASIAILSTMVIVVLTSGFSLYFATSQMQESLFPTDYKMTFPRKDQPLSHYEKIVNDLLEENGKEADIWTYENNVIPISRNGSSIYKMNSDITYDWIDDIDGINLVLDENSSYEFGDNDAILITKNENTNINKAGDIEIKTKKVEKEDYPTPIALVDLSINNMDMLIFKDSTIYQNVKDQLIDYNDGQYDSIWNINFNVKGPYDPGLESFLWDNLSDRFGDQIFSIQDGIRGKKELMATYAGIFFVGIILGLGFLVSTVLAIYYKQLSEGMEDKARFKIMRQLGMTDKEAKKSISKQMGLVFFLPLIFAFVHSLFAIPIITKFLEILSLTNTKLYILCLVSVFAAYIIFYLITFKLTEKTYNNIVLE